MSEYSKAGILARTRDPERWTAPFFAGAAELINEGKLIPQALYGIVGRQYPERLGEFIARLDESMETATLRGNNKVRCVTASEYSAKETEWIYEPYFPRGGVTLIAANPGTGKTFLMCYIAACISTGRPLFTGGAELPYTGDMRADPEEAGKLVKRERMSESLPRVVYVTAEDSPRGTIVPRLRWCGADLSKIGIVDCEAEGMTYDSKEFESVMRSACDMVIVDPFQAFFSEKVDMNAPNKTRAQLNPVIKLAEESNKAVVLVCHLNKNKQGDIINRVLGSMDIVGACRSMLAVGNVPGEEGLKFISHEKANLSPRGLTNTFRIDPLMGGIVTAGFSSLRFDDYVQMEIARRRAPGEKTEKACSFLTANMPDGSRPYKELRELARQSGISEWALKTAADEIGIVRKRGGFPSTTVWYLPKHDPDSADLDTAGSMDGRP